MRIVLFVALLVAGCAAPPPPEREVVVAMLEYGFLPDVIELPVATRVRMVFRNVGRLEHDFVPDQRGRAIGVPHVHLRAGASASRDWTTPVAPTEVAVLCGIRGHKELGMTARLVVR